MLSLLLDQHISKEIAKQIRSNRPDIPILSLNEWRAGAFIGMADAVILAAAAVENITLVTFDRKTIPPILTEWGLSGTTHHGVIFVDYDTATPNDFGRLVRALIYYWDQEHDLDWTNGIGFLRSPD